MFRRQRPAAQEWQLILVSHTHWDREWYMPFQRFRASLVEAVDALLDLMAAQPDYWFFTLDGQTIILEDYLEVRPDREDEIRDLVTAGRLLIGPWYVMPDEFLVSGEALVRNLLEGHRVASRFGSAMKVGYSPDPFGHIAQMPQILRGFGIDSAILWRGTGSRVRQNETLWESPDGSQVLLEHLPGSYSNAAFLPTSADALMERLAHLRAQLEPRATTRYLLLMNGDDHMYPQTEIPSIIDKANRRLRGARLIQGTLPMLIDAIREEASAKGVQWERVSGEFRSSEEAHLLAGVLSSRMNLKQRNSRCQMLLEHWAEPFGSLAHLVTGTGGKPPPVASSRRSYRETASLLRLAWRYLLMNQPHDSICGCSIDQVHQEMVTRYDWCEQVADTITTRALEAIADAADTEQFLGSSPTQSAIAVFNSESGPRDDFVSAAVEVPGGTSELILVSPDGRQVRGQVLREHSTELAGGSLSRDQLLGYLRLVGPGKEWPRWKLKILEKVVKVALRDRMPDLVVADVDVIPGATPSTVEIEVETTIGKEHNYDAVAAAMRQLHSLVERGDAQFFRLRARRRGLVEVGFVATGVPAHGFKLFRPESVPPATPQPAHHREEVILENEYLSCQVSPMDGSIRLLDRETGAIYWGINSFMDGGDAGDEYTYSPPAQDRVVEGPNGPPVITREEMGPARQRVKVDFQMRLPTALTEDRQARREQTVLCPATTWITIYPGGPRLDIRTTFTNLAEDHRLRVCFPTRLEARFSHADGQFAVIQRSVEPTVPSPIWSEHPVTSNPQLDFIDLSDGKSGLMIANRGLPEYDVVAMESGPAVALTLLRCVGWLSRDDLATRRGAAGPQLPTPGAQMPGSHTFEYSVIPHSGNWQNAFRQAYWFVRPLRAVGVGRHQGALGPELSFITASPPSLVLSAVKPADDGGDKIVVRVYNSSSEPVEGALSTYFPIRSAELTDLAEGPGEMLIPEGSRTVGFPAGPWQIVTLRITPA